MSVGEGFSSEALRALVREHGLESLLDVIDEKDIELNTTKPLGRGGETNTQIPLPHPQRLLSYLGYANGFITYTHA